MNDTSSLPRAKRFGILAVCSLSVLIVQIDATAINLALPSISREMQASTGQLQWVIDAYLVVLAALLMFSGSLGDRIGRRKVLMLGLLIFGIGSALCSLSTTPVMLVGMRALQAVGGSMLAPVALSIITNTFTDKSERAQAIGIWGAVVGIGMALGPIVGGSLVDAIDWRAVFWINLPIVVFALVLLRRIVPESKGENPGKIDVKGQLLAIVALASLTFAIIEGGERGFSDEAVWLAAVLALVAGAAFVMAELHTREPLIDLRFFRSLPFSLATIIALLAFFAYAGFLFVSTLYLQDVRGLSPLHAGFATLPLALSNAVMAPVSGRMVGKTGNRLPMLLAGAMMTISTLMLLQLDGNTSLAWFIAASMFMGMGLGTINAPITNTAVSGMPLNHAGVAGATASTARQLGQSLGVAVLGAMLNAGLQNKQPFVDAAHQGWWVLLAVALLITALGALNKRQPE
ncbi:MAG: MFS transporter [Neisseria sp.]|nr:MFS transporter [Neisseria sp.]